MLGNTRLLTILKISCIVNAIIAVVVAWIIEVLSVGIVLLIFVSVSNDLLIPSLGCRIHLVRLITDEITLLDVTVFRMRLRI